MRIGNGDLSATTVYHSSIPSFAAAAPKYPGASTSPHCAPASLKSSSHSSVSSTLFTSVPAMMG